jgi:VanZ family protein
MKNKNTLLRYHALWLGLGWTWIAIVVYLSLTPHPPEIDLTSGDKLGHSMAYAFLMLWFAQLYRARPMKLAIALGLVALGVAIEFAQEQTGYRQFEYADMVADAVGVAIGLLLGETALGYVLRQFERFFTK